MHIKTRMRYLMAIHQWLSFKKKKDKDKDLEKRESLYTAGGNTSWYTHYEKQYRGFSKKLKIELHMIQQSHF